jgi:dihydrolipoamide dehydrogenase
MVVGEMVQEVDLAVLGAGPGGYTAALKAAELGIRTILIDAKPKPGGVCLHEGCIPSKALLHAAEIINTSSAAAKFGVHFEKPKINAQELRAWKVGVTDKLAQGIVGMCKSAGVEILTGHAHLMIHAALKCNAKAKAPFASNSNIAFWQQAPVRQNCLSFSKMKKTCPVRALSIQPVPWL